MMCTRRRRSMTERLVYIFVFIHVFQQERHLQWHNNNNNNNSCGSTSSLSSLPTNALQGGRLLDRPQKCTTGDGQQPQPVSDLLFCADRLYPERNDKQGMLDPWEFKYYGPDPSIDDLDPAKHPLVRRPNNVHEEEEEELKVRLFVRKDHPPYAPTGEAQHLLEDGVLQSPRLRLVETLVFSQRYTELVVLGDDRLVNTSLDDDDVWVIESHRMAWDCADCCKILEQQANNTIHSPQRTKPLRVLAFDFEDDTDLYYCEGLANIMTTTTTTATTTDDNNNNNTKLPHVHQILKRSIVIGRNWSEAAHFPRPGQLIEQGFSAAANGLRVLHSPYPVRTDLVEGIATFLLQHSRNVQSPLDVSHRPIDVAHFYARQDTTVPMYDNLRNGVNAVLHSLEGTLVYSQKHVSCQSVSPRPLRAFVGIAGADNRAGRRWVHPHYVKRLLQSKIVVVAQRDGWVGHYRLLESMVGGALVLADVTQDLPKGLRHGQSLLVYHNLTELRQYIVHYLHHDTTRQKIAQRGWEIAMGYHRSWHLMESFLYGTPQSHVNEPYAVFAEDVETARHNVESQPTAAVE